MIKDIVLRISIILAFLYVPYAETKAVSAQIYVDQSSTSGANNGTSWPDAYLDLQDALAETAVSGGVIRVAEGVYKPGTNRSDTFQLSIGDSIYGGYPAGGASIAVGQNWELYPTILSGDIGVAGNASDNCYHVVSMNGKGNTILEGFIITGGQADGTGCPGTGCGGGLYNVNSDLKLYNVKLVNNYAITGGGVANLSDSEPYFNNVILERNTANFYGGGMHSNGSHPALIASIFRGNTAAYGGGMENYNDSPAGLTNVIFVGNYASGDGGAMYNQDSYPTIRHTDMVYNRAGVSGGGIYNSFSDSQIKNSILWGNQAPSNPQMAGSGSVPAIMYSIVQGGCPSGATCSGNLIDDDPDFVRNPEDGLDNTWGTDDDDYGDLRLEVTSPAIDAGDNAVPGLLATDFADNPRLVDVLSVTDTGSGTAPIADMGVYENPPEIIYVDQAATGADTGLNWGDALLDLQTALKWGLSGPTQIWVAQGTYTPGDLRKDTFQLVNEVEIYGGFPTGAGRFFYRIWTG